MNNKDGEGELRAPLPEPLWHVRLKMQDSFAMLRMSCGNLGFPIVGDFLLKLGVYCQYRYYIV